MDDKERLANLEAVLAQMLKPVRGIPFSVIVKSLSEREVIAIDQADRADQDLITRLERAIEICAFKVSRDARHLLLAFGMIATAVGGSRNSKY